MVKKSKYDFLDEYETSLSKAHEWLATNKVKTKRNLSKFLDKKRLIDVLDKNLKKYQSKKVKGKIKYDDYNYDDFNSITNLRYEILNCFCNSNIDTDYFAAACSMGFINNYNGINMYDVYDLLYYSSAEATQICSFSLTLKDKIEGYPSLFYFNLKIDSKNSYLIKMVDFQNDRAEICDFIVVKKHGGKLNRKYFDLLLMDSLNSFVPQCYPWDNIEIFNEAVLSLSDTMVCRKKRDTNRAIYIENVPLFKEYISEARKKIQIILKGKNKTSDTSKNIYQFSKENFTFEQAAVYFRKNLLFKSNNHSFWTNWPYE